jgi:trehalose 2-sulfotransferase
VASSYRCGSTFFCAQLWRTGVLGAPGEYLNVGAGRLWRDVMMRRLQVSSPADYFSELLARRTSRNGVFGVKVHFPHFEAALSWYPAMLTVLSPVTYIHLARKDALAQAVSLAKAMQNNWWSSMDAPMRAPLVYDEAFIVQCLRDIQQQNLGWLRWFARNNVTPFTVYYEDLVADTTGVVRKVVELLGADSDKAEDIFLPPIEKQSDELNVEWVERFRREKERWTELDGGYGGVAFGWDS